MTIVQASFTVVTYDRQNIFIIQATGQWNTILGIGLIRAIGGSTEKVNKIKF